MKTFKYFLEDTSEALLESIKKVTKLELVYFGILLIFGIISLTGRNYTFGGISYALYLIFCAFAAFILKKSSHKVLKKIYFILTTLFFITMYPNFLMTLPIIFFSLSSNKEWRYLFIFLFVFTVVYPMCLDYFIDMYVGF